MIKISKEQLSKLILEEKMSYQMIGKMYGVTGSAIKKRARRMGIVLPQRRLINPNEVFKHYGKRTSLKEIQYQSKATNIDDDTFIKIIEKSTTWKEIGKLLDYKNNISSNVKERIKERCKELGICLNVNIVQPVKEKTKGELFLNRKNYPSYRSSIRNNAWKIYKESKHPLCCYLCGYDKHVDVAHIKPVSLFPNNALISEINDLSNLVALCPNHHWEYDHGLIKLS